MIGVCGEMGTISKPPIIYVMRAGGRYLHTAVLNRLTDRVREQKTQRYTSAVRPGASAESAERRHFPVERLS